MKIINVAFLVALSLPVFCQADLDEIKRRLTGNNRTKWIFEKLERTMGQKAEKFTDCMSVKFSTLIFEKRDYKYFGSHCNDTTTSKGNWALTKKDDESFALTIDKEYEVDFKTVGNGRNMKNIMRLRIRGKQMAEPSLEYIYYAQ